LFRSLFERSPAAIFVEDVRGIVLDVNAEACRLHGLSREQIVGKNAADLVPREKRHEVMRTFPMWVNGDLGSIESESLTSSGRVVAVEIRGSRIDYGGQPAVLLHVTDITARREADEAVRQSREDLERRVVERTVQLAAANVKLKEEIKERQSA